MISMKKSKDFWGAREQKLDTRGHRVLLEHTPRDQNLFFKLISQSEIITFIKIVINILLEPVVN